MSLEYRSALIKVLTEAAAMPRAEGWQVLDRMVGEGGLAVGEGLRSELPATACAVLLHRIACWPEAIAAALLALRQERSERLVSLVHDIRVDAFKTALTRLGHMRRHDEVKALLGRMIDALAGICEPVEEHGLMALIDWQIAAGHQSFPFPVEGRGHVIDFPLWGDWYIEQAERWSFPCLLAAGNVPRLADFGTVVISIHGCQREHDKIAALPPVRALARYARIEFCAWPREIERLIAPGHFIAPTEGGRMLLAASAYRNIRLAKRHGADYSRFGAEGICSDNFFAECKRQLVEGYDVISDFCPRVVADEIRRYLPARLEDGSRSLPVALLYRAALQSLHPHFINSFMREPPSLLATDPVAFNLIRPDGFVVRTFQHNITAASARAIPEDLPFDFYTPDGRLVSDLMRGRPRDRACFGHDLPGSKLFVHVDTRGGESQFAGTCPVTPETAAALSLRWANREDDFDYYRWAIAQEFRFHYSPDLPRDALPADCLAEDEVMRRIDQAFPAAQLDYVKRREYADFLAERYRLGDVSGQP